MVNGKRREAIKMGGQRKAASPQIRLMHMIEHGEKGKESPK